MFTSNCRFLRRGAFILAVLSCLFVGLFFTGCPMEDDGLEENTSFIPVGVWASAYDNYTITEDTVDYLSPASSGEWGAMPEISFTGDIEAAVDFSDSAGVLIIKVTAAENSNTVGKYTGVYYSDFVGSDTGAPIKMASPVGPEPDYAPVETDTLAQARSLFTAGNVQTHVGMWGSYTKE